ncbi:uncharacterized protein [Palaemon carinicauda]|uniref:uncharacterized protein n=1 Tax=Palaemon carinicauda TaxID=392227 RepID=UPI0035B5DC04
MSDSLDTAVEDPLSLLAASIPGGGIPGEDYPILSSIPETSFSCEDHDFPGYFADTAQEASCQVFHICQRDGRFDSFLCPNGTVFNQRFFVCDWWFNVDCAASDMFTSLNAEIGREGIIRSSANMKYSKTPKYRNQRPADDQYMAKNMHKSLLMGLQDIRSHSQHYSRPASTPMTSHNYVLNHNYGLSKDSVPNMDYEQSNQNYEPSNTPALAYGPPFRNSGRSQRFESSSLPNQNYGPPVVSVNNYEPRTTSPLIYGPPVNSRNNNKYEPPIVPAQNYKLPNGLNQNYGPPTSPNEKYRISHNSAPAQSTGKKHMRN